jgi:hypothetical protein
MIVEEKFIVIIRNSYNTFIYPDFYFINNYRHYLFNPTNNMGELPAKGASPTLLPSCPWLAFLPAIFEI